jgi:hypothetical protein
MTPDLVLAVVGVSAGADLLILLALALLTLFLVDLPRRTSRDHLERRLWRHVDEWIGARKLEADRRASRRRVVQFFSHDLANLLYPPTQLQHAMAYPGRRRRRRYVQPTWRPRPWPRKLHRWDIGPTTYRWTSEAPVATSGDRWFVRLEQQHAQALGLEYRPGLFNREVDWSRDLVTLAQGRPAHVPDQLAAEEELGA